MKLGWRDCLFLSVAPWVAAGLAACALRRTVPGQDYSIDASLWLYGIGLLCTIVMGSSANVPRLSTRHLWWIAVGLGCGLYLGSWEIATALMPSLASVMLARRFPRQASAATVMSGAIACSALAVYVAGLVEVQGWLDHAFAWPLAAGLWCCGRHVTLSGGMLFVEWTGRNLVVLPSLDKLGGPTFIGLLVSTIWVSCAYGVRPRWIVGTVLAFVVYAVFRTVVLIEISLVRNEAPAWWEEGFVALTYLPIVVIYGVAAAKHKIAPSQVQSYSGGLAGMVCAGCVLVTGGWFWCDVGHPKAGTVLIDEFHSEWEWSEEPISKDTYGVRTVYNYYVLREMLGSRYTVSTTHVPLTDDVLSNVSVAIIKMPTRPYSDAELDSIERFVRKGGGVWLIGDHTNVFGTSAILNSVGSRFGIHFDSCAVTPPSGGRELSRGCTGDHPIVREWPLYLWLTSCGVRGPFSEPPAFVGCELLEDAPDFSQNAGFGNFHPDWDERVGQVGQLIASCAGKGRIVAWSDSTVFSNFAMCFPGRAELAFGTVGWLSCSNGEFPTRAALLCAGVLCLLCAAAVALRGKSSGLWCAVPATAGVAAGLALSSSCYVYLRGGDNPALPAVQVGFLVRDDHTVAFPLTTTFDDTAVTHYETAFISVMRTGHRPGIVRVRDEAAKLPRTMVITGWDLRLLSAQEIGKLVSAVKGGRRLVVLDGGVAGANLDALSAAVGVLYRKVQWHSDEELKQLKLARQAAAAGGSGADVDLPEGPVLYLGNGDTLGACPAAGEIKGGTSLLADKAGRSVAVRIRCGDGEVIVSSTMSTFSDQSIGRNSELPNPRQRLVYGILFDWLTPFEKTANAP